MKSIINFLIRLFKLIFGKDVRTELDTQFNNIKESQDQTKPMLGVVYQNRYSFDDEKIIKTLKEWEDISKFKEYCKNNKITENRADVKTNTTYNDQTDYNLKVIASDLQYKLTYQNESKYHKLRLDRIEEWNTMRKNSDDNLIEQWKNEGILCPKCQKAPTRYYDHGLVKIVYDYTSGGPIGAGIHISGTGSKEYQFHYRKCKECDHWYMIEYRETPSWWDDLCGNDCPFTKGDIIEKYQSGKMGSTYKFKRYEITRW